MTFAVGPAVEADAEGIARVHVQGWRESYRDFLIPAALAGLSVEERTRMWRGVLSSRDPSALDLVARCADGEIVGFASGGAARSGEPGALGTDAEIYAIYLLDRVKRRGLGRRLMAGLFEHFAEHGFASAGLWALEDNEPARRFYERLGGRPAGNRMLELRGQTVAEVAYRFEPIPGRA